MTDEQTPKRISTLAGLARVAGVVIDLGASAMGLRTDSFLNPLTGLNTARDKTTHARVKPPHPLSDQEAADMYRANVFARRMCSALPKVALREGIRLRHPNAGNIDVEKAAEDVKSLKKALKKFSVLPSVFEASVWGRTYGRGAILLGLSGTGNPRTPYDPEVNPGRLEFITVLEKRDFSCAETHPDSGLPMLWRLNLHNSTASDVLIHDSRLIHFGGELTSARDRLSNHYADDSCLMMAFESLRDLDTVWRSTVHLVSDASQAVFSVKGFFEMLTSGNVDPLLLRLSMMDASRSSVRAVVMDAEDEKFERTTTNFSGLPEVLQLGFQYAAATADMPVTELMGLSPGGLGSNGEGETRSWYAKGETFQETVLLEPVTLLVNLVAVTVGLGSGWVVEFPSLWTMTPTEEAAFRKTVAETDKIEIDAQVVLAEEVAAHRHSGSEDAWTTPVPIDLGIRAILVEAQLRKLEDKASKPDPVPPAPGAPTDPNAPPTPTPEGEPPKPEGEGKVSDGSGSEEPAAGDPEDVATKGKAAPEKPETKPGKEPPAKPPTKKAKK